MQSFGSLMFTGAVQEMQKARGSADMASRLAERPAPSGLGPDERLFVETRTSFYMATVSETGWPYMQHRGGPRGFLKVLDDRTLGFADYRGNRQYISTGNLTADARVALFLMDYPRQARLKLAGHARIVTDDPALADRLATEGQGRPERCLLIEVAAFDWNCPQFITPRFDADEIAALVGPEIDRLTARIAELEAENARLRAAR
ncbi:pyridoxamine 5'-phosphate oxidase family protein [Oceaniglobus roseus]|uniref:pyridoxamine 5'-phosphate oxidase family protein n=1 Tax=Oceaniglobus roseus TaxID=1737570 RepID=UPI000C7F1079|nr:pyridoxamine 5'-phosphate oxidase family protein [Kandeliimicrobium roseum]